VQQHFCAHALLPAPPAPLDQARSSACNASPNRKPSERPLTQRGMTKNMPERNAEAEARPSGCRGGEFGSFCDVAQDFKMIPELHELPRGPESYELHCMSQSYVVTACRWFLRRMPCYPGRRCGRWAIVDLIRLVKLREVVQHITPRHETDRIFLARTPSGGIGHGQHAPSRPIYLAPQTPVQKPNDPSRLSELPTLTPNLQRTPSPACDTTGR
jgi:hypothetical protein